MNQHLFGEWGLGLSPEDFCRALAAMGVSDQVWPEAVEEEAQKQLVNSHMMVDQPHSDPLMQWSPQVEWLLSAPGRPGKDWVGWARAWEPFRRIFDRVQFELTMGEPSLFVDTVEALATPEVGVTGIYVRQDQPAGEVRWNWPLRVGFLNDQESRRCHTALRRLLSEGSSSWRREYIQLLEPGSTEGLGCHLLLLPGGLEQQVERLREVPGVVRAACVLVLGPVGDPGAAPVRMSELRARARAEGVAVIDLPEEALRAQGCRHGLGAGMPEELWGSWFIDVVRNLSHNQSLDEALFSVWRLLSADITGTLPPIVIASRRLIRESRISFRLARVASQFRTLGMEYKEIKLGPRTASGLYSHSEYREHGRSTPPTNLPLRELADYLEKNAKDFRYDHEIDSGTSTLELVKALRTARSEQPSREPRWLQALVYEARRTGEAKKTGDTRAPLRTLRRGSDHEVAVFIGPREEGAIQPPPDAPPVPEDGLPDDRGVTLTLVFAAADDSEPQVRTVFLPRQGRSEIARFTLSVGRSAKLVEARIIVLYRNRVLQTSILRGKPGETPSKGEEIAIRPETMVHQGFERLEHRGDFDAALVLNDRGSGGPALTALRDGAASKLKLPRRVEDSATWFDKVMEEIADNADEFTSFQSKANLELLIEMAREGYLLWSTIRKLLTTPLEKCDRIQVVSADASTRLPIEFFYDLKAPVGNAKMCPGAADALRDGGPCIACAKRAPEDAEGYVCPTGFWGLRKVLERQIEGSGEGDEINALCMASPMEGRKVLGVAGGTALLAASDKVDAHTPGGIAKVAAALSRLCAPDNPPPVIRDWEEWRKHVKVQASNMLFIMPHVVEDRAPVLEIGADSQRHAANIDERDVRLPAKREPAPLVVLLGCKTGNPRAPFADLIGPFRDHEAAIVLCTGAPIVGRHAVRVATALVDALDAATAAPDALSMGDVIQRVRRHMVAQGLPMVFTLLAFGDHDWRIGRLPPSMSAVPTPSAATASPHAVIPGQAKGAMLVTS